MPEKPSVAVEFADPAAVVTAAVAAVAVEFVEPAAAVAVETAALLVADSEAAAGTPAESFLDTPCIDPVALASHSLVLALPALSQVSADF